MPAFALPSPLVSVPSRLPSALSHRHTCPVTNKRHASPPPKMAVDSPAVAPPVPPAPVVQRTFSTFRWRNHSVNYARSGPSNGPPVLLVHGFGASVMHFRQNTPALAAAGLNVYVIDLLGFGASDKPDLGKGEYCLELWRDLVVDFMRAMDAQREWRIAGNSIGALVALMAAQEMGPERVAGVCLLNSAGGLTSFRLRELNPVAAVAFVVFNFLLFNPVTGPGFFKRFKTRDNVRSVCEQAYAGGHGGVTEELVSILCQPSDDEGAAEVFLAVLNGPPGPTPEELLRQLHWCPLYVLWGEDDPFTPFSRGAHPDYHPTLRLDNLGNCGHCPHDAVPEVVNAKLIPFLMDPRSITGQEGS